MKKWQILAVCLIAMIGLIMAGCTSKPTQTTITQNNTPTDLGTNKSEEKTTPPIVVAPVETVVNKTQPIETTPKPPVSTSQVRLESVTAFGTKFDDKYVFNRIEIMVEPESTLDLSKLNLYLGNKYFNSTSKYNESINCSSGAKVIVNRNKFFYVTKGSDSIIICGSPAKDLYPQDTLSIKLFQESTLLLEKTVTIPGSVSSTQIRLN